MEQKNEDMVARVALMGIAIDGETSTAKLGGYLSDFRDHIVGQMSTPCPHRGISMVTVVLDAPNDTISALAGKIGMLPGISVTTAYMRDCRK